MLKPLPLLQSAAVVSTRASSPGMLISLPLFQRAGCNKNDALMLLWASETAEIGFRVLRLASGKSAIMIQSAETA
jgi:hypothetical protein